MASVTSNHDFILALRISLMDSEPEIWRRFIVPYDITLMGFHEIIQIVMGWQNAHLFEFHTDQGVFTPGVEDTGDGQDSVHPVGSVTLKEIIQPTTHRFEYVYDLGDDWDHEIFVEELLSNVPGKPLLQCLEGANQCPPEDIGGMGGYEAYLAALADPSHEEYEYYINGYGDYFDPTNFDLDGINKRLQKIKRKLVRAQSGSKRKST